MQREGSITNQEITVKNLDIVEALCVRSVFYKRAKLLDLNSELCQSIKSVYDNRRVKIRKVSDKNEKKRLREIDKIFRKTYFENTNKIDFFNKVKYTFPMIWFRLCGNRWIKMFRRCIKFCFRYQ